MTEELALDLGLEPTSSSAEISACGRYRYELTRRWADGPLLEWVMLNPSTADADQDDPTIRRCKCFAKDWGFNGIRVVNLFAWRATNPDELLTTEMPFGGRNAKYLTEEQGPVTVCAWGTHKAVVNCASVSSLRSRSYLACVGYNKDGSPKHPLYAPKNAGLRPWPKPKNERIEQ